MFFSPLCGANFKVFDMRSAPSLTLTLLLRTHASEIKYKTFTNIKYINCNITIPEQLPLSTFVLLVNNIINTYSNIDEPFIFSTLRSYNEPQPRKVTIKVAITIYAMHLDRSYYLSRSLFETIFELTSIFFGKLIKYWTRTRFA